MSLEVFGDEGDVPLRGEDTAMYQELVVVRERWSKWLYQFKGELPGPDHEMQSEIVSEALDEMIEALSGPL